MARAALLLGAAISLSATACGTLVYQASDSDTGASGRDAGAGADEAGIDGANIDDAGVTPDSDAPVAPQGDAAVTPDADGSTLPDAPADCETDASVCVITLAGSDAGLVEGPIAEARFDLPIGVAIGTQGVIYVADFGNDRIRKIDDGQVSTFAGDVQGLENGPAAEALFSRPSGVAVNHASGAVYVADTVNNMIRKIEGGVVSTFAGDSEPGFVDGHGSAARFRAPEGIAVAPSGTIYVADTENHAIRRIDSAGNVATLAATSAPAAPAAPHIPAPFDEPTGVAVAPDGRIFVADSNNNQIQVITQTEVLPFAGQGGYGYRDGPAGQALFASPWGVAVDSAGRIYVTDAGGRRVRLIEDDVVSTLAGAGPLDGPPDLLVDGDGPTARFSDPRGIAVHPTGRLVYVTDPAAHRLRLIALFR